MKKGPTFGIFTATCIAVGMLTMAFQNAGTIKNTETIMNKKLHDGILTIEKRDIKLKDDDYKVTLSDKNGKNRLYIISDLDGTNITIKDEKGSYSMITMDTEGLLKNKKTVLDRKFDMGNIEIKMMNRRTKHYFEYNFYEITIKDDKGKYEITMEVPMWDKPKIKFTDDEGLEYKFKE